MRWFGPLSSPSPVPFARLGVMFESGVLAVHYMIAQSPKRLTGIRVYFKDGTSKVFHGADLAAALAVVKVAFPPQPGSQWVSGQPVEKD